MNSKQNGGLFGDRKKTNKMGKKGYAWRRAPEWRRKITKCNYVNT